MTALPAPEWPFPSTSHVGMRVLRLRRRARQLFERRRDAKVRGVQRWMALDLWMALGYDPHAFDSFINEIGFAETWSTLLGEARVSQTFQQQIGVPGNGPL